VELKVEILPSLIDNYIYLVRYNSSVIVFDPGDAACVEHYLEENDCSLKAIVITHHHSDHIDGLLPLKEKFDPAVYAPQDGTVPKVDTIVKDGDTLKIGPLKLQVIHTPGHTKGHVVYYEQNKKWLFSGDTLFGAGCGKLFEGTAADMYSSFLRLGELDPSTQVYCGHEYTKTNLTFAHSLEPNNVLVAERLASVEKMQRTVPFELRNEFETNPYFRVDDGSLRTALDMTAASSTEVFAEIRKRKDSFKP